MDLRELYYLNALAEEQSISKAAERLYIAQASLSQFLRQFEAQLGSPIFVRTNKGIRPTPSGKVFLSHAKHILKEYQQAQQEFWDNENTVGGTVFFGVSSFRGSYVIPPILKKFYDQNPRATINIYEGNSMNLVEKIREGELDLALSAYPIVSTEGWDNENTVGGTVFFGVSSFRGSYVIPPILKKFYDQNPRATINIYEGNSMNLVEKIREGELDLALSAYPIVSTEGIQMEYLYRDEVLLVATKDHPILQQARMDETGRLRVSMEEVTHHECILSGKDTMLGHLIRSAFGAYGLRLKSKHGNITAAFAASMARVGLALAFTYRSCIVEEPDVVYLSLGSQGLYLRLALLSPTTDYRSKATLALTKLLREELSGKNADKKTPSPSNQINEGAL